MRHFRQSITYTLLLLFLAACSSSSDDPGSPPAAGPTATFTATVTAIDIDRTADQSEIAVTGLPAEGATITVQE